MLDIAHCVDGATRRIDSAFETEFVLDHSIPRAQRRFGIEAKARFFARALAAPAMVRAAKQVQISRKGRGFLDVGRRLTGAAISARCQRQITRRALISIRFKLQFHLAAIERQAEAGRLDVAQRDHPLLFLERTEFLQRSLVDELC